MTKAKILVLDKNGNNTVEEISVSFNPNEYTISRNSNIKDKELWGNQENSKQFMDKGSEILIVELFFDTYIKRDEEHKQYEDVRNYTKQIKNLQNVVSDYHHPPICAFSWGSLYFKSFVESVTEKFTMFSNEGIPLRATVNVVFSSVEKIDEMLKKNSFQSADRTKVRVLKDGEYLWTLANNEYDDSSNWRPIARKNRIDNPRKIKSGTRLIVPSLE